MCGITGYIDFREQESRHEETISSMVRTLSHRGPDDFGSKTFRYTQATVALAQTRLSIIDLTQGGHQPMETDRFAIVFNGEIYNYREIREELRKIGLTFKSESDTEVILKSFEAWGTDAVGKFIGMFAFVILDKAEQVLFLFRDRVGVKPLYIYNKNNVILFGSELKALMRHPGFERSIDGASLTGYFHHGYISGSQSIFNNCEQLKPGHFIKVNLNARSLTFHEYWSARSFFEREKTEMQYEEACDQLESLLISACQYRMVADVPVGVFLSGGYDSTLVAALLQKQSANKLKTFTIGFTEGNNEAPAARRIAERLGTDHHEYICDPAEAKRLIAELPYYYDEPFADSSAIPTLLVSQMARKSVTVALSADGGDELFAGYNNYRTFLKSYRTLNRMPPSMRKVAGMIATTVASLSNIVVTPQVAHRVATVGNALNEDQKKQALKLYLGMKQLPQPYIKNILRHAIQNFDKSSINVDNFKEILDIPLYIDYVSYLPGDILTKVDRATMSVSLEGREPLLDHRVLEFAAQLPSSFKFDGTSSKRILKELVHRHVSKELMDRPKTGFSLPIYRWLRGDLSYLIDTHLNKTALEQSGLFNTDFLIQQINDFRKGNMHYKPVIWRLLMFQMWFKKWMK